MATMPGIQGSVNSPFQSRSQASHGARTIPGIAIARKPLVRKASPHATPEATSQPTRIGPVARQARKKKVIEPVTRAAKGPSRIAAVPRIATSSDVMKIIAAIAATSHRAVQRRTKRSTRPAANPVVAAAGSRRANAFSPNPRNAVAVIQYPSTGFSKYRTPIRCGTIHSPVSIISRGITP